MHFMQLCVPCCWCFCELINALILVYQCQSSALYCHHCQPSRSGQASNWPSGRLALGDRSSLPAYAASLFIAHCLVYLRPCWELSSRSMNNPRRAQSGFFVLHAGRQIQHSSVRVAARAVSMDSTHPVRGAYPRHDHQAPAFLCGPFRVGHDALPPPLDLLTVQPV